MRILHYFLGFPPFRSGGLVTYACSLMESQVEDGNKVYTVWPGKIELFRNSVRFQQRENINGIINFEMINPLPVSLDEGINNFQSFTKSANPDRFRDFFYKIKPDVIHIHTLMGLYKEFVEVANDLHIKTVFTTHDYFGLCPKITLYKNGDVCKNDHNCKDCTWCNRNALSLKKITLLQSSLYRRFKNTNLIKSLRKQHRNHFFEEEKMELQPTSNGDDYKRLREFYIYILELVDCIHFNSTLSESVYRKYIRPKQSVVLNISHKDIIDCRNVSLWKPSNTLRITFLASLKPYKGFYLLQEVLDELWLEGNHSFICNVYFPIVDTREYIKVHNDFDYSQLKDIMDHTDVLVAPSIWYETFGFTVLEALSFGVPVIVSNRMGSKDIVKDCGIIVDANNKESLKDAICSLNKNRLIELREKIKNDIDIMSWRQFVTENYKLYQ